MSCVRSLGIFAGGRGTRLFGSRGGCKALSAVCERPLIDYVLAEAYRHGVANVTVALSYQDQALGGFLRADRRFDRMNLEYLDADGTMAPVLHLTKTLGHEDFFLSTCDVIPPIGALTILHERLLSARATGADPLALFLATRFLHDRAPIWIDAGPDGVIHRYGKNITPAPLVFGHIRLCTPDFRRGVEMAPGNIRTDTELMAATLRTLPRRFLAVEVPGPVFDVDDPEDVRLAEAHLRTAAGRP